MHASAAGGREGGEDAWEGSGGGDLDGACFDYDADDLSGPETSGMRCFVALSVLSGGVWVWGHGGGGGKGGGVGIGVGVGVRYSYGYGYGYGCGYGWSVWQLQFRFGLG